jgi:hypothetical protein
MATEVTSTQQESEQALEAAHEPSEVASIDDINVNGYLFARSVDHVLKAIAELSKPFGGDVTTCLLFFAIARTSVQHMNKANMVHDLAVDGVFPDEYRRPVSILSMANYLGLPYETARRHVMKLVDLDYCKRIGSRAFLVNSEIMKRPELLEVAQMSAKLTRGFVHTIQDVL